MLDKEFGIRFTKILDKSKITNTEVTKIAEISKNNIGNYKNGQIPNATTLYKLSQIFGISMEYLLTGKESEDLTQDERKLVDLYRNTNDIGQPLTMKHAEDIQQALPELTGQGGWNHPVRRLDKKQELTFPFPQHIL